MTDAPKHKKIEFRDLLLYIICRSTQADMNVQQMVQYGLVKQESAASLGLLGGFDNALTSVQNLWATEAEYTSPPCPDIPELQAIRQALDSSKRFLKAPTK